MSKQKKRKNRRSRQGGHGKWGTEITAEAGSDSVTKIDPKRKMSEIILDFATPLMLKFLEYEEDTEIVIMTACLFWNLACMKQVDPKTYSQLECEMPSLLGGEPFFLQPDSAMNLISLMIRDWEKRFSGCKRMVADHHITWNEKGFDLEVISTPWGETASAEMPRFQPPL